MTPLTRHQVLLYRGDFARLNELYSTKSATEVIRELVHKHIGQVEARVKELEKEQPNFGAHNVR